MTALNSSGQQQVVSEKLKIEPLSFYGLAC